MGKNQRTRKSRKEEEEKRLKEIIKRKQNEKNYWTNFWRRSSFWIYAVCLALTVAYPFLLSTLERSQYRNINEAIIHTSMGDITVSLYNMDAPKTTSNFVKLSQSGYYNGLLFHRVIKDFMIQGGDPKGDGTGGESAWGGEFEDEINADSIGLNDILVRDASFLKGLHNEEDLNNYAGYTVKEFYKSQGFNYNERLNSHKLNTGSLAMANSGPNTNGSQFFIVTGGEMPHLDGRHTVFGQVVSGMDVATAISEVSTSEQDNKPTSPVTINSIEIK